MYGIIHAAVSLMLSLSMLFCVTESVATTPQQEAEAFLGGMSVCDGKTMERYMDNYYVNFIGNIEADDDDAERMRKALFSDFEYEISDMRESDGAAVVKVRVVNNDFSGVMKDYRKESYRYVKRNLYSDSVTDKEKLADRCMSIYVDQIVDASEDGEKAEKDILIPMVSDGLGGWNIILDDEAVRAVLGGLAVPGK